MRLPLAPTRTRFAAVVLSYLCALGGLPPGGAHASARAAAPAAPAAAAESHSVRQLLLPAKDLVVDPATQTIFASLPSIAGANGNSLVPIDPSTATVGTPVFVGSEPNQLALSDDGKTLYVALDGAAGVRRFDLATRTAGLQFSLGYDGSSGALYVDDMAVQPGSPGTLAVSRRPGHSGSASIALFDDGVRRNAVVRNINFPAVGFDAADPTRLYTLDSAKLTRLAVTPAGLMAGLTSDGSVDVAQGFGDFRLEGGRLYTANGRVFDPATGSLLGTFAGDNIYAGTNFVIDPQVGRAYFITEPLPSSNSGAATLHAFDLQTFLPAGKLDIPGLRGSITSLVRWGSNGLAYCTTEGQVFIVQTTLVPSADPVPSPSPTPALTPTPTPTPPSEPALAHQLPLNANDLVYDPARQLIYASVPSRAGAGGNSVVAIDPAAETVGAPLFVGSEPNRLARSDDGQFLYVALDGAGAVRRIDLAAQAADLKFSLGNSDTNTGPLFVEDMEVAPGEPHTIAVARRNTVSSPGHEGVAVYDDGVRRAAATPRHTGSNAIEFSSSAATLYGYETNSSLNTFRKMAVDASGVSVAQATQGVGLLCCNTIKYDAGRVYFTSGRVIDPETAAALGTFPGAGTFVVPETAAGRVYLAGNGGATDEAFNTTMFINAYDTNTFLPAGRAEVKGVNGRVRSFIRWGANGFAFSTSSGQVFLVRTSLVPSSEPAPVPTPAPTATPVPTPTPAPTPAPGQFRQLALATNDLVYEPVSQTLFASVPAGAGAGGNSVTPIDPVAGAAGTPVHVGDGPNRLAVSDDGQYVYVGLDGAAAVRRVAVATRTAGLQFSLGSEGSQPYLARDIAVAPGQPGTVAVVRRPGTSTSGVAVYDEGVQRPVATTGFSGQTTAAEFSASPEVLYGYNGDSSEFGLRRMAVAPCGVVPVRTTENVLSGFNLDFKVENGVAYSSYGRAADPEAPGLLGTFLFVTSNFTSPPYLFAAEAKAGRVYYLLNENGFVLRVFDNKTFLKVGELRLPGVTGTVSSLVRWGADGLAFRSSSGQVYLLRHPLVGGTDPSYVPAAPPAATTTATATGRVFASVGDPAGTQVSLSGAGTGGVVTVDSDGAFAFQGVPVCGGYTLTPSKPGYAFTPSSITFNDPSRPPVFNFTATLKTVGFTQSARTVSEAAGRVLITVARNVGTDQPASVSYETASGTASDRSDFNTTLGTLHFAPGESAKTVTVLLADDALVEGPEAFTVTLKDAVGAALAQGLSTITVNVNDNDAAETQVSPLEDARFFVAQHYRDFLNRNAADDPAGFDFWTKQITDCAALADPAAKANCLEDRRINVSAAFFLSIEFQQTGYLVHRLYTASFPDTAARPKGLPRFREFLGDTQEIGRGVVVNVGNWEQQLEANKQAFVLAFVGRPEFAAAQPEGLTAGEFVDRLFANARATPTGDERAAAVAAFGAGGAPGRAAALRSVAESKSVSDRQFNSGFVLMQYFGYLRRGPDEPPDANFDGYDFWLAKLDEFHGNFIAAEMVRAFLISLEYQDRFGPRTFDIRK